MIPLNYHHLYYFWVVAKSGSITKASKRLYLAQPTLSLQIRQLEKSLGHKLFHRTREGITLTAEGRLALDYCERIFLEGEALARRLSSGSPAGPAFLRLGVTKSMTREVVLSLLDAVDGSGSEAAATITTGSVPELVDRLSKYGLEAAVSEVDLSASLGAAFRCRRAGALPIKFMATPQLARKIGSLARPRVNLPMLLRTPETVLRRDVEDSLVGRKIPFTIVAETENVALMRILALRGRGVAALTQWSAAEDLKEGRLVCLKGQPRDLQEQVWLSLPARAHPDSGLDKALSALGRFTLAKALRS